MANFHSDEWIMARLAEHYEEAKLYNGSITYTYDVNGLLTSIIQDNITYSFTYNNYNDVKTIKINNDTILSNNYNNFTYTLLLLQKSS